jgi:NTP pyrophosphatase (non-canonical NTP hydrolase)
MLNKLRDEIHETAKEKGWWDEKRSVGDMIALCHSELSEALEEYRSKPQLVRDIYYDTVKLEKPEGFPIELADTMIRILDIMGRYDIDADKVMGIKMAYNKTRSYRHGGKAL